MGGLGFPERVESEYEVSRTVVRGALRSLEVLGIIRARHKAGTTVQPQESWALRNPQVIARPADSPDADSQLGELRTLREALEVAAARIAALGGQQDLIATLRACHSDRHQFFTADTAASLDRHEQVVEAMDPALAVQAAAGALGRASRDEIVGSAPAWER
ncbi:FadR/GntR family transcriptional regulator [Nonomuraea jabiensis]|uniref:FadR/GntR family transcriptional regulator n=1 Tax=Nonomuraea jabiensis TaxID=882448 RepID=UPI003D704E1B